MLTCGFLEPINKEISKRLLALDNPSTEEFSLGIWNLGLALTTENDKEVLNNVLDFATRIEYHHVGLTPKAYLAHPVRVAGMTLFFSNPREQKILGTVALLHNVLEVSNMNIRDLELKTDSTVAAYIQLLTVQRDLQNDGAYLNHYYNSISSTPHQLALVKIIDKLDNLIMLGLNPDEDIRIKYLNEIENYVLPMVKKNLPELTNYMESLIIYNRQNGLIEKSKYL